MDTEAVDNTRTYRTLAYVLMGVAVAVSSWHIIALVEDVEDEAINRSTEICEASNELRSAIIDLVSTDYSTSDLMNFSEADLPPVLVEFLESELRRRQEFREATTRKLALQNCAKYRLQND